MTEAKEKIIKTETLHFIMTGEFITEQSRLFWLDKRCDVALRMLMCVEPMNEALAIKILSGKKKLVGQTVCDNPKCSQCKGQTPMHLENDNAKMPSLYKMFKNIRKDSEKLHKEMSQIIEKSPYLMTPEDMLKVLESAIRTMAGISPQDRSYITERVNDLKEELEDEDTAPHLTPNDNPQYEFKSRNYPGKLYHLQGFLDHIERRNEAEETPIEPDDYRLPTGWLSPDGKWFSGEYMDHAWMAHRLTEKYEIKDNDAERALEKAGWIKFGRYLLTGNALELMWFPDHDSPIYRRGPSKAQKNAIWDMLQKHKIKSFRWKNDDCTYEQWLNEIEAERRGD